MMAHTIHNHRWNVDDGNNTLITNYPLDEDSWVLELGGFEGWFTEKLTSKINCNIIVVEPISEFCKVIKQKFSNNPKIRVECVGISYEKRKTILKVNGDSTSEYMDVSSKVEEIECYPIEYFIEKYNVQFFDLVQMNIEGEEYQLLEKWIDTKILSRIKYLQVQYHEIPGGYEERKKKIENGLIENGFENVWDYDIVFTSWKNKKF